jgi:hypothetical protein
MHKVSVPVQANGVLTQAEDEADDDVARNEEIIASEDPATGAEFDEEAADQL